MKLSSEPFTNQRGFFFTCFGFREEGIAGCTVTRTNTSDQHIFCLFITNWKEFDAQREKKTTGFCAQNSLSLYGSGLLIGHENECF